MNEITIGDKVYISAKRAAEITGYARDYVGQLCREGHVDAKMVGRSWYVYEPAIRAHRFGPEAVTEPQKEEIPASHTSAPETQNEPEWQKPTYTAEKPELLPELEAPRLEELLPPAEETLTDMQAAWREWFLERQTELSTPEIESTEVIDERNDAQEAQNEAQEAEEFSIPLHHLDEEPEEMPQKELEEAPQDEVVVPIRPIPPPPSSTPAPQIRHQHVDIAAPQPAPTRYTAEMPVQQPGRVVSERIVKRADRQNRGSQATARTIRTSRSAAPIAAALIGISLISIAVAAIGTGYADRYLQTLPAKNNPAIQYLVGTREYIRP